VQALRRASGGVAGVGTYPTGDTRGTLRASGRTHQKRREEHPSFLPDQSDDASTCGFHRFPHCTNIHCSEQTENRGGHQAWSGRTCQRRMWPSTLQIP